METRNALNYNGDIIGTVSFPEGTEESMWQNALASYAQPPTSIQIIVENKIKNYKSVCEDLMLSLKAANTLAGITTAESAEFLILTQYVVMALHEGMLPTAIYLAEQITPQGFLTQERKDSFIVEMKSKL